MAYIQKNLPSSPKSVPFTLSNFSGGLNNVTSDSLLGSNEASDILNMVIKTDGTSEKRFGTTKYSGTVYNSGIKTMHVYKTRADGDKLMVCTSNILYDGANSVATVAKPICGVTYLNNFYFVDGVKLRIYGTFPQTSTGANMRIVGTPTTAYQVMTVITPPAFTPLANPAILGVWVYDYTNHNVWYEPCANELGDAFKGSNSIPPTPSVLVVSGDRLFMDGDSVNFGNVFISDVQNSFYFPSALPIQMPPNGEQINGMIAYMDGVVIGRKSDVNCILGNTNRTSLSAMFVRKQIHTHAGFMNNNCVKLVHDYLFYLGSDGIVYRMSSIKNDVDLLSTSILSQKVDLTLYPVSLTKTDMASMSALFLDDSFYLFHNNLTLVYSYRFMAWTIYKMRPTLCATVLNDVLLYGGANGIIYKPSTDYSDDGLPIQCYLAGKRNDFGMPSNYKQFKELFVVAHVFDGYTSDALIRYEVDYVDIQQVATISNQLSLWGTALWGSRFITRNISPSLPINIGRRGRVMRIIVMNGETARTEVTTYADMIAISNPVANDLVRVINDNKVYRYNFGAYTEVPAVQLYQPFKLYQINGEYKIKGKR